MTYSHLYPVMQNPLAWNAAKTVGTKPPLTQKRICAIRFVLEREERLRDRALFAVAIDSKLSGCDLVKQRPMTFWPATTPLNAHADGCYQGLIFTCRTRAVAFPASYRHFEAMSQPIDWDMSVRHDLTVKTGLGFRRSRHCNRAACLAQSQRCSKAWPMIRNDRRYCHDAANAAQAQYPLDACAVHPSCGTGIPAPASSPLIGCNRINVGRHHIGFDHIA
jgi:hypothetical protein